MKWFREKLYPDFAQVLKVDALIHQSKTAFQDVTIFENAIFGRVLALDGVIQLTERDNHIYHEMIAHVPMVAHPSPRRVLIVGGGDGGTLREVLKHEISSVVVVEIDGEVMDLCRRFLPSVPDGAFEDPRVTVEVADGRQFVSRTGDTFDIIIIDSTDPSGPGEELFTPEFYASCRKILSPDGIIVAQSGAPFFQAEELNLVRERLGRSLAAVRAFLAPVPTYAGGMLALVAAGASEEALSPSLSILNERFAAANVWTRYYTPEVHRAAFVLPPSFRGVRSDRADQTGITAAA
ncbi:MAG: polyamine aminopropyltransferase [Microvirga sp.]|jgi:spermidine synthase|nr:polyamine aminopropyltransferase [Microvirga sp.]